MSLMAVLACRTRRKLHGECVCLPDLSPRANIAAPNQCNPVLPHANLAPFPRVSTERGYGRALRVLLRKAPAGFTVLVASRLRVLVPVVELCDEIICHPVKSTRRPKIWLQWLVKSRCRLFSVLLEREQR